MRVCVSVCLCFCVSEQTNLPRRFAVDVGSVFVGAALALSVPVPSHHGKALGEVWATCSRIENEGQGLRRALRLGEEKKGWQYARGPTSSRAAWFEGHVAFSNVMDVVDSRLASCLRCDV